MQALLHQLEFLSLLKVFQLLLDVDDRLDAIDPLVILLILLSYPLVLFLTSTKV